MSPTRSLRFLLALLLVPWLAPGLGAALPPNGVGDELPFAKMGEDFIKVHGGKDAADLTPEVLLDRAYVHAALGLFDVNYPRSFLSDKTKAEELRSQCQVLVQLQARWIDWLTGKDPKLDPARKAAADLEAWVKGWRAPALMKAAANEAKERDLYAINEATELQIAAQKTLSEALSNPDLVGAAPREVKRMSIVFSPTRRDFVEMLGYAGLHDPTQQASLWTASSDGWTSFWLDWNFVLAMQYPSWGADPAYHGGTSMNKFEPTGLSEHTVQNAANALQWLCYGDDDAPFFHQAVSMNLAIAICGELNTLDGNNVRGTTGARTEAYEKFVPGGNPAGGVLPPIPAAGGDALKEGHWREGGGKDHYAGVLRKGQKEALKQFSKEKPDKLDPVLAKDKGAHFLLINADNTKRMIVSAPFFGPHAKEKPYPPQEILLDYREFFRAYKSCFYDWLQRMADKGNADTSAAKFHDLMRKVATRDSTQTFEDLVQTVYGVPLSAKNGDTDCLEWRFLDWLTKGK